MKDEVKNLGNTSIADVTNDWVIINRKENIEKRCLKLTQAFQLDNGCLVKTSTEFRDVNWNIVTCSEGVTFVPNTKLLIVKTETGYIKNVLLIPMNDIEIKTIENLLDTKPKAELDTKVFGKAIDSFVTSEGQPIKGLSDDNKKK